MSKILIENYRGFDIEFDPKYEKFQCVCTEEDSKESSSFAAIKKFIDEYKKQNADFKPFWVDPNPKQYTSKGSLKIVGIRKDGRLVCEDSNGKKTQLSDFYLNDYILRLEKNSRFMILLDELKAKEEQQRVENNNYRKDIISKIDIVSLKDYKKTL